MHKTAIDNAKHFFRTYATTQKPLKIVEIGSRDVNGTIRGFSPANAEYIGLDFAQGAGVDIVLEDPYNLPVASGSVDIVISTSCFEHSEFFWLLFNDIMRVLKPDGIFYLNAPSNGAYHKYPVDCWRFYPDCGNALASWANRSGYPTVLLESFTTYQDADIWNDYVAVFLKDGSCVDAHPYRILPTIQNYSNGLVPGRGGLLNEKLFPEDIERLHSIKRICEGS